MSGLGRGPTSAPIADTRLPEELVRPTGLEPATSSLKGSRSGLLAETSIHLSYGRLGALLGAGVTRSAF